MRISGEVYLVYPRLFLTVGGAVLLLLGIVGLVGQRIEEARARPLPGGRRG